MKYTIDYLERLKQQGKIQGFSVKKGKDVTEVKVTSRSKYGNQKVVLDGIKFDSQKEANRYVELRYRKLAGEIKYLELQVVFELEVKGEVIASYVADFVYEEKGVMIVEDVKSPATRKNRVYRLKKKLMKSIHGIDIREA